MNTIIVWRETYRKRFFRQLLLMLPFALAAPPAMAAETVTLEMETQALDLDGAAVLATDPGDPLAATGADIKLAYHADRASHAVVFPVAEGVEMAFVADTGFDGVTSEDVASLTFSSEPTDLAFTASNCVVVRTDQGAVYKIGNASESGTSVTFNSAAL